MAMNPTEEEYQKAKAVVDAHYRAEEEKRKATAIADAKALVGTHWEEYPGRLCKVVSSHNMEISYLEIDIQDSDGVYYVSIRKQHADNPWISRVSMKQISREDFEKRMAKLAGRLQDLTK